MNYYDKQLAEWAKRRELIRQLHDKGMSWNEIARRYNITPQRAAQLGKASGKATA